MPACATKRTSGLSIPMPNEAVARRDGIADIGTIEPRKDQAVVRDAELGEDIGARVAIGGCGQREPGDVAMGIEQAAQLPVIGAEVMPPFGHAMRLVDGDKR